MLSAYIDDSGWDGKSPVFVLAGYLSSTEKWSAFSDEWRAVRDLQEPRPLPYLKMADAYQLKKRTSVFYGWTEDERDARLKKFCPVINRHVEHGIAIVVPIEAHRKYFRGLFAPEALDRPYFLSFFSLASLIAAVVRKVGYGEKVELIYDTQENESKSFFMEQFEKFMQAAPPSAAGLFNIPKWEDDKDVLPLQAADMLAWHIRRYFYDYMGGRDPANGDSHACLANIVKPRHDIVYVWDEEKLMQAADTMRV